jgi:hypothetical protein
MPDLDSADPRHSWLTPHSLRATTSLRVDSFSRPVTVFRHSSFPETTVGRAQRKGVPRPASVLRPFKPNAGIVSPTISIGRYLNRKTCTGVSASCVMMNSALLLRHDEFRFSRLEGV